MKKFDMSNVPEVYKNDIETAINILKGHGCTEIFIFGSLADGIINTNTDIDIAVRGISESSYFYIWSKLYMALHHPVDLINLDKGDNFSKFLLTEGRLSRVA